MCVKEVPERKKLIEETALPINGFAVNQETVIILRIPSCRFTLPWLPNPPFIQKCCEAKIQVKTVLDIRKKNNIHYLFH